MKDKMEWGDLVETADGSMTLRHPDKQEEYHSKEGARLESEELYITASGFQKALLLEATSLAVLDVGLGLGYNALTTIHHWWHGPGERGVFLHSLEVNSKLVEALAEGCAPWTQGWSLEWLNWSTALQRQADGLWQAVFDHPIHKAKKLIWTVRIGDATEDEVWNPQKLNFDFIWQDPFSPQKNPEMWTVEWFKKLAAYTRPNVTLMTYSVARTVRDALAAAGWDWEKLEASGKKRNWLKASFKREDCSKINTI